MEFTRRVGKRSAKTLIVLFSWTVPVLIFLRLLEISPWWEEIIRAAAPFVSFWGLPGEATFPLIGGMLLGTYSGVAALLTLDLEPAAITVISVMLVVAHALPMESAVQHRAGGNGWYLTGLRVLAAAGLGWVVARLLGLTSGSAAAGAALAVARDPEPWSAWLANTTTLLLELAFLLTLVTALIEWLRQGGRLEAWARRAEKPLAFWGLTPATGVIGVTALVFGVFFGAGVLLQEVEERGLGGAELRRAHSFSALCHSLIEDNAIFAAMGASLAWLFLPRLLLVWLLMQVMLWWEKRGYRAEPEISS